MSRPEPPGYAWRYKPRGKVVHLVRHIGSDLAYLAHESLCGEDLWDSTYWMGTGTQGEYDRAGAMPECKRCLNTKR